MATSDSALKKNEQDLEKNLSSETIKQLKDVGLGALIERIVGSGAGVITFALSLLRSQFEAMRQMAQQSLRDEYGTQQIYVMGQQVAGQFSSEECWKFISKAGGTLWVQDVQVTKGDGLAFVVFWHPDHTFKLKKDIIRIYRSVGSQCLLEDTGPQIKAGR